MGSRGNLGGRSQPVPQVTSADVERIVHRDFPYDGVAATELLNEYGTENRHPEVDRVRLAALKLSGTTLHGLRRAINTARQDYRNVLGPAEFPSAMQAWSQLTKLPAKDRQRRYAGDWQQYENWLRK